MLNRRPYPAYKAVTLALGLWLLFMQCALTYHAASVEKHKLGEQCELCIAAADFAGAVPAGGGLNLFFLRAAPAPDADSFIVHSFFFAAYAVRAPPSFAA